MRVLVMGADGMFGHEMVRTLVSQGHEAVAATRRVPNELVRSALDGAEIISGIDARIGDTVASAIGDSSPDAVINAIGIVKQRPAAKEALESIRINSLLPHQLAALCKVANAKFVHISTDCVFSGNKGSYTESDYPDPLDLYGRSKLMGEVDYENCTTLRTSIIGLELFQKSGLVEWFLRQEGTARGWTGAIYSGLTTPELARIILNVLGSEADLHGLWHVSADPISKFDLLAKLRDALGLHLELIPDGSVTIDRSMLSQRFRLAASYSPPSWDEMVAELAQAVAKRESEPGV